MSCTTCSSERCTENTQNRQMQLWANYLESFVEDNISKTIHRTPYSDTPTSLVELGVGTLKENPLTNINGGERSDKTLDMSLEVMRNTQHRKLRQSALELLYVGTPNTEISTVGAWFVGKVLFLDHFPQNPYSFSGAGGGLTRYTQSEKQTNLVNENQFFFLIKFPKISIWICIFDEPQIAVSKTNHTATTPNWKIKPKKCSLINCWFHQGIQQQRNQTRQRGPNGRYTKITIKTKEDYNGRIGQWSRHTNNGMRELRTSWQNNDQVEEEQIRSRQTEADKTLSLLKLSSKFAGASASIRRQHCQADDLYCPFDRQGDRLC